MGPNSLPVVHVDPLGITCKSYSRLHCMVLTCGSFSNGKRGRPIMRISVGPTWGFEKYPMRQVRDVVRFLEGGRQSGY